MLGFADWFKTEFLTPRRLVFNVLWYGMHIGVFAYGWWAQDVHKRLQGLNQLGASVFVSRGAGLVLAVDGFLILVPMLRNIIRFIRPHLTWLFPADENIWFHRQVAYSMAFWAMVHTTAHYVNFINVERLQLRANTALEIHYARPAGVTGHLMLLIMVLMYSTAHQKIRQQCFEAFWYSHHLAFFFMIALYLHAVGCFVRGTPKARFSEAFPFYDADHCLGYMSWRATIWPAILYFGERVYREVRARRQTNLGKVLLYPCGVMEFRIDKPSFKYNSGQWLFFQCPTVSSLEWHPFTITSAPEDPYVSVHIRQVGDFTKALGEAVGATPAVVASVTQAAMKSYERDMHNSEEGAGINTDCVELDSRTFPLIRIDGPYGAPAEDVIRSEVAVLIGAGIGVTPFASLLKHIWYLQKQDQLGPLRRVEFFWICRDAPSFAWFRALLQNVESAQTDPDFLKIHIYLTRKPAEGNLSPEDDDDEKEDFDPLTLLKTKTMYGRPDWKSIYENIRQAVEEGRSLPGSAIRTKAKVGTYFCGPREMGRSIRAVAFATSTKDTKFTFAKEHF